MFHCFSISRLQSVFVILGFPLLVTSCGDDGPTVPKGRDSATPLEWSWQNPQPQGNPLRAVHFVNATTGTTVGDLGTILRTTDGGSTWVNQTSGTIDQLRGVSFTDAITGTAVGRGCTIVHTTDGGSTWVSQTSGTVAFLNGVSFTDALTGTAVGSERFEGEGSMILHTIDGGNTWVRQWSGTSRWLSGVSFTDATTGTIVGYEGTILRTRTSGVE